MRHHAFWFGAFAVALYGQQQLPERPRFPSPDNKWEFRVIDETAALVRAGSKTKVVDLGEEIAAETARLIWAPDSRRFAFDRRKSDKYWGSELYELAGETWKKLPRLEENAKPVDEMIERALREQGKRLGAKEDSLTTVMDQWRVRRWIDKDTFEAYVSERRVMVHGNDGGGEYLECAVLFEGRCDKSGGWKVISSRELSEAELGKIKYETD